MGYDEMKQLESIANRALARVSEVDDETWPSPEVRQRLIDVLAYAVLVIEGSDPALVSHSAVSAMEMTLTEFVNAAEQLALESEGWIERVLDQLGRFPPAQGHDFEQRVKDGLATFQRSAQQRLSKLEKEAHTTQSEVASAQTRMNDLNDQLQSIVSERVSELQQAVAVLQTGSNSDSRATSPISRRSDRKG